MGDRLFTISAGGKLHALDAPSGRLLWSHDFVVEYEASIPPHGYAASPLAFEGMIITPVGGTDGRGLMAFDPADGRVLWQDLALVLGYSSPALIDVDGEPQVVLYTKQEIVGADACSGRLRWLSPHRAVPQENATLMPLWGADGVLWTSVRTAGEGDGCRAFRISRSGDGFAASELYWNPEAGVEPYANAVRVGELIYTSLGFGRRARLACIEAAGGRTMWQKPGIGTANCIYADGRLIVLGEKGRLLLASPSREGLEIISHHDIGSERCWTAPALIDGRLIVRDSAEIMAFQVGEADTSDPGRLGTIGVLAVALAAGLLLAAWRLHARSSRQANSP
jgi:outer membrane protein assembly factor BamB